MTMRQCDTLKSVFPIAVDRFRPFEASIRWSRRLCASATRTSIPLVARPGGKDSAERIGCKSSVNRAESVHPNPSNGNSLGVAFVTAEHTTNLRVRYDECDSMGFVHHSNYLRYFEIARMELFRTQGGQYREIEASGLYVVVVRVDCRYRLPAKYDDEIAINVRIERMTEAKIEQSYRVSRGDDSIAIATVWLAVIDRNGLPQRIPESLRKPRDD